MDMRTVTKQVRLTYWANIMRKRSESKKTVKRWCLEQGIHEKTYFYWQRKLREAVIEDFEETQKQVNKGTPLTIEESKITTPQFIEIINEGEFDPKDSTAIAITDSFMDRTTDNGFSKRTPDEQQLQIKIGGIEITAGSTYPTDALASLIKELVRS